MHLICYHPYYSCLYIFWPYYPYLLVCINFFNSRAILRVRGMGADMDKILRVGYPTRTFVLHSLLHKCELQSTAPLSLSMTSALIDSECEVPEPLALQNMIITGLAQVRY